MPRFSANRSNWPHRWSRESGSVTLEVAVLAPGLILLIALVAFAGRMGLANSAVEQSAADGARAASLERGASAAREAAQEAVDASLADQGLQCTSTSVSVDTSGFATAPGQSANVTVTVTCPVRVADLPLPGLGPRSVQASAISPIDTYRER